MRIAPIYLCPDGSVLSISYSGDIIYSGVDSSITLNIDHKTISDDIIIQASGQFDTSGTTATREDVLEGKFFYASDGRFISGSIKNGNSFDF